MGIPHSNSVSTVPRNNQFLKQISPSTGNCDMLFLYYPIILAGIFQGRTIRRRLPLFGKQDIFIFKPSYKKQSMYPDFYSMSGHCFLNQPVSMKMCCGGFGEMKSYGRSLQKRVLPPLCSTHLDSLGEIALSCGPGRTGKVPSEL